MSVYTKQVQYLFEVDEEEWAVTAVSDRALSIEETRKNGQEDTHMCAAFVLGEDGRWEYEWGRDQIEMYHSEEMADAVLAFINEHGPPPTDLAS